MSVKPEDIMAWAQIVPTFANIFASAIASIRNAFGVSHDNAVKMLVDHVDPTKPADPKVAAVLDANSPNPV